MRYILILFFVTCHVNAADLVSINLDREKVLNVVKMVYGDVSKQDFVIDSSVIDNQKEITIHLQGVDSRNVASVLEAVLESAGIVKKKIGKIVFLTAIVDSIEETVEVDEEMFFYRPKFRSVSYITDLSASLFKKGRFSFQRQVKAPPPIAPTAAPAAPSMVKSGAPAAKPVDAGNSALSNMDKDHDAFIFTGLPAEVEKLKQLLVFIDRPGGEIVVKGTVFEVATNTLDGSAVGLALNLLNGKIGVTGGVTRSLGNAITLHGAGSFAIDAVLSALSTDSRFKVISSPTLRVKSGGTGRLSSGSDVPVLGAIQTTATGLSTQSVEYKPSGVIIKLPPAKPGVYIY